MYCALKKKILNLLENYFGIRDTASMIEMYKHETVFQYLCFFAVPVIDLIVFIDHPSISIFNLTHS